MTLNDLLPGGDAAASGSKVSVAVWEVRDPAGSVEIIVLSFKRVGTFGGEC